MKPFFYSMITDRRFLILLFIINFLGTIYGYIWYESQLKVTPAIFIPFVPDSPTASLFFSLVLIAFLLRKNWPYLEALALITLVKYGVWAVVMNILAWKVTGNISWQAYMLIFSHSAMAFEGIVYANFYKMKRRHVLFAAIWSLHNDVIDYVFLQYPKYPGLEIYVKEIGYFTFWLSILSVGIAWYYSNQYQKGKTLSMD